MIYVILKYYDYEGNYEVFEGTKEECKKFLSKVNKKDYDDYTIYIKGPTVEELMNEP